MEKVPSGKIDDEVVNEDDDEVDDIEEILDVQGGDEEEDEYEDDEEEEEEDEVKEADEVKDQKVDIPKKPEDKTVVNDVPKKPTDLAGKIEDVKVPNVPEKKDAVEIKKPELPKVTDVEVKEKETPKAKSEETEKKEKETPKLKPEFEVIEKESPINVVPSKLKSDFEVIERDAHTQLPADPSELKPEFEIVEREDPKTAPAKDAPQVKPEAEVKGKEAAPKTVQPEKQESTVAKPGAVGTGGSGEPAKEAAEKDSPKPPKADNTTMPEKTGKNVHVKFDVDDVKKDAEDSAGTGDVRLFPKPSPAADRKETRPQDDDFLVLEKGAANQTDVVGGPRKTDSPIDAFISGEQRHTVNQLHPESIQDQQL